jgi:hypothetical protein
MIAAGDQLRRIALSPKIDIDERQFIRPIVSS